MLILLALTISIYGASAFSQDSFVTSICGNSSIVIEKDHCEIHLNGHDHVSIGDHVIDRIRIDNGSANAVCLWKTDTINHEEKKIAKDLSCCIQDGTFQTYLSDKGSAFITPVGLIKTVCKNATQSCIDGAMFCDGSNGYAVCDHGTFEHIRCPAGTSCKTVGPGNVICDSP